MPFADLKPQFIRQGPVEAEELEQVRQQLHYAIFSLQALSTAYAPFQQDWSHISFQWDRARGGFVGQMIPGKTSSSRFALLVEKPTVLQLDGEGRDLLRSLSLNDVTLEDYRGWLRVGAMELGLNPKTLDFTLSKEIPAHELSKGKPFHFEGTEKSLSELKHCYSNAHLFLERIHQENPETSPVRCWPHHFDLATRFQFELTGDSEPKKTLEMGLSPGDHYYATPYYYVTPSPFSMDLTLPPLPSGGFWRLDEWQGAVLPYEAVTKQSGCETQFKAVCDFLITTRQFGLHLLRAGQRG